MFRFVKLSWLPMKTNNHQNLCVNNRDTGKQRLIYQNNSKHKLQVYDFAYAMENASKSISYNMTILISILMLKKQLEFKIDSYVQILVRHSLQSMARQSNETMDSLVHCDILDQTIQAEDKNCFHEDHAVSKFHPHQHSRSHLGFQLQPTK